MVQSSRMMRVGRAARGVARLGVVSAFGLVQMVAPVLARDATPVAAGPAKHVILFIGDGMGDSEITSARNSEPGANGRFFSSTPCRTPAPAPPGRSR